MEGKKTHAYLKGLPLGCSTITLPAILIPGSGSRPGHYTLASSVFRNMILIRGFCYQPYLVITLRLDIRTAQIADTLQIRSPQSNVRTL